MLRKNTARASRLPLFCRFGDHPLRARRCRCKRILVMQAAQHRFREHERTRRQSMSGFRLREDRQVPAGGSGTPGPSATVRPAPVVMFYPALQNRAQMRLRHRDHPVQTFSPNRSDHPFADRIRLRTRDRRSQHFDAQRLDRVVQVLGEDPIPVMDQIPVRACRLRPLLSIAVASSPPSGLPSRSRASAAGCRAR